jgi:hypothetical protein
MDSCGLMTDVILNRWIRRGRNIVYYGPEVKEFFSSEKLSGSRIIANDTDNILEL